MGYGKKSEKFIEKNLLPHHYYYWKCEKNHMWKETWEKEKKEENVLIVEVEN